MMHVSDIEEDLSRKDLPGIRAAFRALIDFPHEEEVEGAESVDQLEDLLQRVALVLEYDRDVMPASTLAAVQAAFDDPLYAAADYAAGSTVARRFRDHWRALFTAHFPTLGDV